MELWLPNFWTVPQCGKQMPKSKLSPLWSVWKSIFLSNLAAGNLDREAECLG